MIRASIGESTQSRSLHIQHIYWALACLLMLACIVFVDNYQSSNSIQSLNNDFTLLPKKSAPTVMPMHFAAVTLPHVPGLELKDDMAEVPAGAVVSSDQNLLSEHVDNVSESRDAFEAGQQHYHDKQDDSGLKTETAAANKEQITHQQVQTVFNELAKAKLQIAMPSSPKSREQVLNFLYECAGVGLGAIFEKDGDSHLMPLSKLPSQPSTILRTISGEKSVLEQQLKSAYAPNQALVRVYPVVFDAALSAQIARNLQDQHLTAFFAEYHLHQHILSVTNIHLNNIALGQTWLLFDGYAQGCSL